MSLDGAQLNHVNADGISVAYPAKGRKFNVGSFLGSDLMLPDAERVHCEIQCDAFGRVTVYNYSVNEPILLNDQVVPATAKRPLVHGARLKILNELYTWHFPKVEDAPNTPDRMPPEQAANSSPSLKTHRARRQFENRFTVHNFRYSINSDDEGNTSIETPPLETSTSSNAETDPTAEAEVERCVTPSVQEVDESLPKVDLVKATQNKENTRTPCNKLILELCDRSDVVITSFSPRETGVKIEKSFTRVIKPSTGLGVGLLSAANTPKSVYSTPKSVLSEQNDDSCSRDLMDFSTPSTSKKALAGKRQSSMYLIDLTTPQRLRPTLSATPKQTPASAGVISVASTDESSDSPMVIDITNLSTPSTSSATISKQDQQSRLTAKTPKEQKLVVSSTPRRTPQSLMKRALLTSAKKQLPEASKSKHTTPVRQSLLDARRQCLTAPRRLPFHPQPQWRTPGRRQMANTPVKAPLTTPRKRQSSVCLSSPRDNKISQLRKSLAAAAKVSPSVGMSNKLVAKARRALNSPKQNSPQRIESPKVDTPREESNEPDLGQNLSSELSRTFTLDDDNSNVSSAAALEAMACLINDDEMPALARSKQLNSSLNEVKPNDTIQKELDESNNIFSPNDDAKRDEIGSTQEGNQNRTFDANVSQELKNKSIESTKASPTNESLKNREDAETINSVVLQETASEFSKDSAAVDIIEDNICEEVTPTTTYQEAEAVDNLVEDSICEEVCITPQDDAKAEVPEASPEDHVNELAQSSQTPLTKRVTRRSSMESKAVAVTPRRSMRRASIEASNKLDEQLSRPKRRASCSSTLEHEATALATTTPKRKRRLTEELSTSTRKSVRRISNTPKAVAQVDESVGDMGVIVEEEDAVQLEDNKLPADEDYGNELPSDAIDEPDRIDYHGMRELLKTPKSCSTPRFKGLREMMRTPKAPASPVLDHIEELLEGDSNDASATPKRQVTVSRVSLELTRPETQDLYFKTPSDSLAATTEYDLNATNATVHLDKIFDDMLTAETTNPIEGSEVEINVTTVSTVSDTVADPLASSLGPSDTVNSEALMTIGDMDESHRDPLTSTAFKPGAQADANERYLDTGKSSSICEMSGIQMLDQTSDSMFSEPLIVTGVDSADVTLEETKATGTVKACTPRKSILEDCSDTDSMVGLAEPLVVSDDEDDIEVDPEKPNVNASVAQIENSQDESETSNRDRAESSSVQVQDPSVNTAFTLDNSQKNEQEPEPSIIEELSIQLEVSSQTISRIDLEATNVDATLDMSVDNRKSTIYALNTSEAQKSEKLTTGSESFINDLSRGQEESTTGESVSHEISEIPEEDEISMIELESSNAAASNTTIKDNGNEVEDVASPVQELPILTNENKEALNCEMSSENKIEKDQTPEAISNTDIKCLRNDITNKAEISDKEQIEQLQIPDVNVNVLEATTSPLDIIDSNETNLNTSDKENLEVELKELTTKCEDKKEIDKTRTPEDVKSRDTHLDESVIEFDVSVLAENDETEKQLPEVTETTHIKKENETTAATVDTVETQNSDADESIVELDASLRAEIDVDQQLEEQFPEIIKPSSIKNEIKETARVENLDSNVDESIIELDASVLAENDVDQQLEEQLPEIVKTTSTESDIEALAGDIASAQDIVLEESIIELDTSMLADDNDVKELPMETSTTSPILKPKATEVRAVGVVETTSKAETISTEIAEDAMNKAESSESNKNESLLIQEASSETEWAQKPSLDQDLCLSENYTEKTACQDILEENATNQNDSLVQQDDKNQNELYISSDDILPRSSGESLADTSASPAANVNKSLIEIDASNATTEGEDNKEESHAKAQTAVTSESSEDTISSTRASVGENDKIVQHPIENTIVLTSSQPENDEKLNASLVPEVDKALEEQQMENATNKPVDVPNKETAIKDSSATTQEKEDTIDTTKDENATHLKYVEEITAIVDSSASTQDIEKALDTTKDENATNVKSDDVPREKTPAIADSTAPTQNEQETLHTTIDEIATNGKSNDMPNEETTAIDDSTDMTLDKEETLNSTKDENTTNLNSDDLPHEEMPAIKDSSASTLDKEESPDTLLDDSIANQPARQSLDDVSKDISTQNADENEVALDTPLTTEENEKEDAKSSPIAELAKVPLTHNDVTMGLVEKEEYEDKKSPGPIPETVLQTNEANATIEPTTRESSAKESETVTMFEKELGKNNQIQIEVEATSTKNSTMGEEDDKVSFTKDTAEEPKKQVDGIIDLDANCLAKNDIELVANKDESVVMDIEQNEDVSANKPDVQDASKADKMEDHQGNERTQVEQLKTRKTIETGTEQANSSSQDESHEIEDENEPVKIPTDAAPTEIEGVIELDDSTIDSNSITDPSSSEIQSTEEAAVIELDDSTAESSSIAEPKCSIGDDGVIELNDSSTDSNSMRDQQSLYRKAGIPTLNQPLEQVSVEISEESTSTSTPTHETVVQNTTDKQVGHIVEQQSVSELKQVEIVAAKVQPADIAENSESKIEEELAKDQPQSESSELGNATPALNENQTKQSERLSKDLFADIMENDHVEAAVVNQATITAETLNNKPLLTEGLEKHMGNTSEVVENEKQLDKVIEVANEKVKADNTKEQGRTSPLDIAENCEPLEDNHNDKAIVEAIETHTENQLKLRGRKSIDTEEKITETVAQIEIMAEEPSHLQQPKRRGRKATVEIDEKKLEETVTHEEIPEQRSKSNRRGRKPTVETEEKEAEKTVQQIDNESKQQKLVESHHSIRSTRRGRKSVDAEENKHQNTVEDATIKHTEVKSDEQNDLNKPKRRANKEAAKTIAVEKKIEEPTAEETVDADDKKPNIVPEEDIEHIETKSEEQSDQPKSKRRPRKATVDQTESTEKKLEETVDKIVDKPKSKRGRKPTHDDSKEHAGDKSEEENAAKAKDLHKPRTRRGQKPTTTELESKETPEQEKLVEDTSDLDRPIVHDETPTTTVEEMAEKTSTDTEKPKRRGRKPSAEVVAVEVFEPVKPNEEPIKEKPKRRGRKASAEETHELPERKTTRNTRKASAETVEQHEPAKEAMDVIEEAEEPLSKILRVEEPAASTTPIIRRRGRRQSVNAEDAPPQDLVVATSSRRGRKATTDTETPAEPAEVKPKRRGRKASADETHTDDAEPAKKLAKRGRKPSAEVEHHDSDATEPAVEKKTAMRRVRKASVQMDTPTLAKKATARRGRKASVAEEQLEVPKDLPESSAVIVAASSPRPQPPSSEDELTPRRREGRNLPRKNYDETSDEDKRGSTSSPRRARKPAASKAASKAAGAVTPPVAKPTTPIPSTKQEAIVESTVEPLVPHTPTGPPVVLPEPTSSQRREGRNVPRKNYNETSDDDKPGTSRARRVRQPTVKALELLVDTAAAAQRPVTPRRRKAKDDGDQPSEKKPLTDQGTPITATKSRAGGRRKAPDPADVAEVVSVALSTGKRVARSRKDSAASNQHEEQVEQELAPEPEAEPKQTTKRNARGKGKSAVAEEEATDEPATKKPRGKTPILVTHVEVVPTEESTAKRAPASRGRAARTVKAVEDNVDGAPETTAPARAGRGRKVHFEATEEATTAASAAAQAEAPTRSTRSRRK
ncbi:microtubule-associated protein futsch isoform X3 [Drosophila mojavensis]|uniref:microtubule-associated protein futsch isoform X3 n=1 Tax=Drosophila mojavensis TaxID=7230 RepID=UPI0013EE8C0A|nr:microtubule-associated protein futsch isoform X3 [Drosophila mojavensis]